MAQGVSLFITGDEAMDVKLAGMPARVQKKLARKAARTVAKPVRDSAKSFAPFDTGELEESIKVRALPRSRRNKDTVGVQVVTGDTQSLFSGETFYGGFQELGTKNMEPNPFMIPAMMENEGTVLSLYSRAMTEIVAQEEAKS